MYPAFLLLGFHLPLSLLTLMAHRAGSFPAALLKPLFDVGMCKGGDLGLLI